MSSEFNAAAPAGGTPSAGGARAGRDGSRGGTGAAPSNTAPDNSIGLTQPLRWGIDSLYLSYPGHLSDSARHELADLKKLAQQLPHEAAKAQYAFDGHVFEVSDKGTGLFAFRLSDGAFDIKLSTSRGGAVPMAYVQVRSRYLAHKDPGAIENHLRSVLRCFGEPEAPKVSRVDLFFDFASAVDMEGWKREAWVTKASAVHQYAEDATFTGWSIGAGSALMARLYLKSLECRKTGKDYLLDLWKRAGWDGETPVWRLEFEFRREVLAQLKLASLPEVMDNLDGLWSYATTDWLKLCQVNPADRTRSRWPLHPLWLELAAVDWRSKGGPLTREFRPATVPSDDWFASHALSLLMSVASAKGLGDFEAAAEHLLQLADTALGDRQQRIGVSPEELFAEGVAICNRKYAVRLNKRSQAEGPKLQNPYYRATQGLK
jgi:hypothetical protein